MYYLLTYLWGIDIKKIKGIINIKFKMHNLKTEYTKREADETQGILRGFYRTCR